MQTQTSTKLMGKVIQVAGPAVDIQFPEGQIPVIYTAIRITSEGFQTPQPIATVNGFARCCANASRKQFAAT